MRQAQINVRTRACSRTSIARTKQAALTHNVRGKELIKNNLFLILMSIFFFFFLSNPLQIKTTHVFMLQHTPFCSIYAYTYTHDMIFYQTDKNINNLQVIFTEKVTPSSG